MTGSVAKCDMKQASYESFSLTKSYFRAIQRCGKDLRSIAAIVALIVVPLFLALIAFTLTIDSISAIGQCFSKKNEAPQPANSNLENSNSDLFQGKNACDSLVEGLKVESAFTGQTSSESDNPLNSVKSSEPKSGPLDAKSKKPTPNNSLRHANPCHANPFDVLVGLGSDEDVKSPTSDYDAALASLSPKKLEPTPQLKEVKLESDGLGLSAKPISASRVNPMPRSRSKEAPDYASKMKNALAWRSPKLQPRPAPESSQQ